MESRPRLLSTHCPYCALQCGMDLLRDGDRIDVTGNRKFPVNEGGLCVKGMVGGGHAAPSRSPADAARPRCKRMRWCRCVGRGARPDRFGDSARRKRAYGRDAVGVFGGGSLTNEKAYLLGKFARVGARHGEHRLQRPVLHVVGGGGASRAFGHRSRPAVSARRYSACARRFCSSAATSAETMPPDHAVLRGPATQRRHADRGRSAAIARPRNGRSCICDCGPASDAALANGLMHLLIREALIDADYIRAAAQKDSTTSSASRPPTGPNASRC